MVKKAAAWVLALAAVVMFATPVTAQASPAAPASPTSGCVGSRTGC